MPAAINASVYLMISVPYAVLGVLCFLIYRGLKKNAEFRSRTASAEPPGDVPCPLPSPGAIG